MVSACLCNQSSWEWCDLLELLFTFCLLDILFSQRLKFVSCNVLSSPSKSGAVFFSAGQGFVSSVGRKMMIWRTYVKISPGTYVEISSVVISKDVSQASVCRRHRENLNASRLKSIYPLTLTFCDKVKHIQLTFSFKSEFAIKGLFIQAQDGPFHFVPGSLILRTSWGSLSQYKLICCVLHSKPKTEGPYIPCKLSEFNFQ